MDRYSRTVAVFKVLLPLAALALLSTVFLLSHNINPTATIPFSDHEVAERLRDKQITGPVFSATTRQGGEIRITASQARPGGAGTPATATDLRASITSPDGLRITLQSATGSLDLPDNRATFTGTVRIETTTGYVLATDVLHTSLDTIDASTPGQITGNSPIGRLIAGQMQIRADNGTGSVHMLFNNGVKLVYTPQYAGRNSRKENK